jgi:hypothetical protein
MDNVEKVCHFNNTSLSQTFRIYLVIVAKNDTFAYLYSSLGLRVYTNTHVILNQANSPIFSKLFRLTIFFIFNKILSVQQMPQVARVQIFRHRRLSLFPSLGLGHQTFHTFEAHTASYAMGTGGPFPEIKRGRGGGDADHSHLVPRSSMSRSYISSPIVACMAVAGQLYFIQNFKTTGKAIIF